MHVLDIDWYVAIICSFLYTIEIDVLDLGFFKKILFLL